MPPAGFETTVSAGESSQIYALDRVATGIVRQNNYVLKMKYYV